MLEEFDHWNRLKKEIEFTPKRKLHIKQREIYFINVGKNIGYEVYGKGELFLRPVLVYKKLSKYSFIGIPLSSQTKTGSYFFNFTYKNDKVSTALLNQLKVFDLKRAVYFSGKMKNNDFERLEEKLIEFIKVTPQKRGGILQEEQRNTKNIILQNSLKVKRRVLVTGANGQVGSEIRYLVMNEKSNNSKFFFTNRDSLDITNKEALQEFIYKNGIDSIINTAAYTAVDKAEEDEINAGKVNHLAVKYLAEIAKEKNISLVHISTDYVFDGKNYKPYKEDDTTNPQGVYGKTKLDGEKAMQEINPVNSIIIRTSWVYSSYGNNFVKTMLRLGKERDSLGVIFDQVGTPTYARDLAKTILHIIGTGTLLSAKKVEIYNYSNEGVLSWYDFAKEIMRMAKLKCQINPIETKEYPTPAKRPHYSLLNKAKIKKDFDITIPYWKESLDVCLQTLGERK